ncbi:alpha/beta-Hydrolases superfamily protein [Tasmannia lanceolata]|uniref:alpha/beta-Hydrolases superfamily protein n=1 Tax=Tasmannia lanceolata TaxID=3420 RepID=UPI0040645863
MAVIKEEEEDEKKPCSSQAKEKPPSLKSHSIDSPANAFAFWAYFTISVSLVTIFFIFTSSLSEKDERSWFLSLPDDLRSHYSKGKTIKVQINPSRSPIEVFVIEDGPKDAETLVFIHGLGSNSFSFRKVLKSLSSSGFRAIAIDLPGSGFSSKSVLEEEEKWDGVLGQIWDIYSDIKEKGLFWGFDQLIETGHIPYEENEIRVRVSKRNILKPLRCRSEELGRIIGQVINSMDLAPVHLVLHDSGLGPGTNWVSQNPGSVSSVTLVDATANSVALPLWVLEMPVIREVLLGFPYVYVGFLRLCCSRSIETSVAEVHKKLIRNKDGRRAVIGVGKGLNYSFDLGEWAGSDMLMDIPVRVLWSGNWSKGWIEEGFRVANMIPRAKFVTHSGGRWPQEDAADEIAEKIGEFVSSLPKSILQIEEEPLPDHIQKMFDEADNGHHHHHHHHHHGAHNPHGDHDHVHSAGYMDAYGLGHGWGS